MTDQHADAILQALAPYAATMAALGVRADDLVVEADRLDGRFEYLARELLAARANREERGRRADRQRAADAHSGALSAERG